MKRALWVSTLLVAGITGCTPAPIYYHSRAPAGPPRARGTVPAIDLVCKERVGSLGDCFVGEEPPHFRTFGAFYVPKRAAAKWDRYKLEVLELAADLGCPAVAFRKVAPNIENEEASGTAYSASSTVNGFGGYYGYKLITPSGEPIGAFCVDPAAVEQL